MFVFNWEIFGAADMVLGWDPSPPGRLDTMHTGYWNTH